MNLAVTILLVCCSYTHHVAFLVTMRIEKPHLFSLVTSTFSSLVRLSSASSRRRRCSNQRNNDCQDLAIRIETSFKGENPASWIDQLETSTSAGHRYGPNRAPGFLGHVARLVHGLSTTEQRQVSPFQGTAGQALVPIPEFTKKYLVRPTDRLADSRAGRCGKIGMVPVIVDG
jgi:hypothetical protein